MIENKTNVTIKVAYKRGRADVFRLPSASVFEQIQHDLETCKFITIGPLTINTAEIKYIENRSY